MADDRAGPPELDHALFSPLATTSTILSRDTVFGLPIRVRLIDSWLVVTDASRNPLLEVLDPQSGEVLGTFGTEGQGPGEFVNFPIVVAGGPRTDTPGRVWLFDSYNARMTLADLPTRTIFDTVQFRLEENAWQVTWGDGLFLASGRDSSYAMRIFDGAGKVVRRERADTAGWGRIPVHERADALEGAMCTDPTSGKTALAYRWAGRVELYDGTGAYTSRAREPHPFEPWIDRHPLTRRLTFHRASPNRRAAYYDCAATRSHVFALFSGRLNKDFARSGDQAYSRHVHVFDWSGALVSVLQLDHPAVSISVDGGLLRMYTVDMAGVEPAIRVTTLTPATSGVPSFGKHP